MAPFTPPPGYTRIQVVTSFEALVHTPFADGRNAICWTRELTGDFGEVVRHAPAADALEPLDEERLRALPVGPNGRAAVDTLLADLQRLRSIGHAPQLDCIRGYAREANPGPVPTDVYSFHKDSATVATDTYLCSYTAPASEGLRDDEAQRCVDIAVVRAQLRLRFGGDEGPAFEAHLQDHCFDLHYRALPCARPFSFGVGNLWRIAVQYPGCPVPACIHRAPATLPGQAPRLLLIS